MLIIPVLVITMSLAIGGYALTIWLYQKRQAQRRSVAAASAAAAHRTAVSQGVPAEASADVMQDTSCHPPPVPVVVLDPDGRVTVAYLLRVSNQSYLVTQKSEEGGNGSRASCSLGDRSLSQPAERSLRPPPGWPASSCLVPAAGLTPAEQHRSDSEHVSSSGPGCSECNAGGTASAWAGREPLADLEKGMASESEDAEGPATPVAAERRCGSSSGSGSTGAGSVPAVEACVQDWAPA